MKDNKINIFQKLFKGSEENEKMRKKIAPKLILALLALGILLMFSGSLFQTKKDVVPAFSQQPNNSEPKDVAAFSQKNSSSSQIEKEEKKFEEQLKDLLEGIVGVKDVTVVVNLDSTDTKVLEKDRVNRSQQTSETDRDGGKRDVEDQSLDEKIVIIREGDKETPIVVRTEKPEVRGVAITAKGADNIEVKKMIIDAVTRMLGVPSHRVSVLPKKN
jgi:stage III sporulation protein AG